MIQMLIWVTWTDMDAVITIGIVDIGLVLDAVPIDGEGGWAETAGNLAGNVAPRVSGMNYIFELSACHKLNFNPADLHSPISN